MPEPDTNNIQCPDTDNTNDAQATQQAIPPRHARVLEQGRGKQHGSELTHRVPVVAQGGMDEDALEDDEDGDAVEHDVSRGRDLVDIRAGSPREDEQAERRVSGRGLPTARIRGLI